MALPQKSDVGLDTVSTGSGSDLCPRMIFGLLM